LLYVPRRNLTPFFCPSYPLPPPLDNTNRETPLHMAWREHTLTLTKDDL
jgi:hypothetical protein